MSEYARDLYNNLIKEYENGQEVDSLAFLEKYPSFASLLAFSDVRKNLLRWISFNDGEKVLEVGAGYGNLTRYLLEKGVDVTCMEEDSDKEKVNRFLNPKAKFCAIEDLDIMDGYDTVLVWNQNISEIVKKAYSCLKPNGRLIVAVNNVFGLRNFNGYMQEGKTEFFEGLWDCNDFSQEEIIELVRENGFEKCQIYYPYPDYEFPSDIFTMERLPKEGELHREEYPFERYRMQLYREQAVWDSIINHNKFHEYANSFLIISNKDTRDGNEVKVGGDNTYTQQYVRFSTERSDKYKIRTEIQKERKTNILRVCKFAEDAKSVEHIKNIYLCYLKLLEKFECANIEINKCDILSERAISFEYIQGESLDYIIDSMLRTKNREGAKSLIRTYVDAVYRIYNDCSTEVNQSDFQSVFGVYRFQNNTVWSNYVDVDMIFQNIIVDPDNRWNVIDYEWTFPFAIPINFVIYRAIFFYYYQSEVCRTNFNNIEELYTLVGITSEETAVFSMMESNFQEYVRKGAEVLSKYINDEDVIPAQQFKTQIHVFFDFGKGWDDRHSIQYSVANVRNVFSCNFGIEPGTKKICVIVDEQSVGVRVLSIAGISKDERITLDYLSTGHPMDNQVYLWMDGCPRFEIEISNSYIDMIELKMEIFAKGYEALHVVGNACIKYVMQENQLAIWKSAAEERMEIIENYKNHISVIESVINTRSFLWKIINVISKIKKRFKDFITR